MKLTFKERLFKTVTCSGLVLSMAQPVLGVTTVFASPTSDINTVGTSYEDEDVDLEELDIRTLLEEQDVNIVEVMELIQIKEEEVLVLISQIGEKEADLDKLEDKIEEKNEEISILEDEIEVAQENLEKKIKEYEENIERAASRAITLQKQQKDKATLYIDAVLNAEGLGDVFNRVRSVNIIMSAHEKQIYSIEEQAEEIEEEKVSLEKDEQKLLKERKEIESMRNEVKSERDALLEEKENADKMIEQMDEERDAIQEAYDGNIDALFAMQETASGVELFEEMLASEAQRMQVEVIENRNADAASVGSVASIQNALRTIRGNRRDPQVVQDVLEGLQKYIGVPYVWGGTTPNGFDCSGLVQWVYRDAGINLPRVSQDQSKQGVPVAMADAQPGDLLFWERGGAAYHVAVYIGGGEYIHAPRPGKSVEKASVKYFTPAYARRVIDNVSLEEAKETKVTTSESKNYNNYNKGELIGEFQATAYAVGGWAVPSTVTANGTNIKNTIHSPEGHRIIAVDPRVIPMNSIVYVEAPGMEPFVAKASDTGGAIKGNIIDILMGSVSEANKFGRQNGLKVYKVK